MASEILTAERVKEIAERWVELRDLDSLISSHEALRAQLGQVRTVLREYLIDFVGMNCGVSGQEFELDSMAISTNAEAMNELENIGVIKIHISHGRRVLANWVKITEG